MSGLCLYSHQSPSLAGLAGAAWLPLACIGRIIILFLKNTLNLNAMYSTVQVNYHRNSHWRVYGGFLIFL
jgi:hypothetical protein